MSVFLVVSYDIADDRRRLRVASELENFGQRVQKSVFECHLDEDQIEDLKKRIAALISSEEDRVRYYRFCPKDLGAVLLDGRGAMTRDPDYHMV
jgi:CRISPR-associated protein Cas2